MGTGRRQHLPCKVPRSSHPSPGSGLGCGQKKRGQTLRLPRDEISKRRQREAKGSSRSCSFNSSGPKQKSIRNTQAVWLATLTPEEEGSPTLQ